jgi:uncharacterized protein YndB with AHSA1/START domain
MNDLAKIDEHNTVTLVRDIPGPIERVWAFLTDPKYLALWLSDGLFTGRVGGEVRLEMGAVGHVTVFEPPHLLEYTWNEPEKSRGPVLDTLVRWQLAGVGNRVRLTLTHTRLSESEAVAHAAGWHALVDGLSARLDGTEPPDIMERIYQLHAQYAKDHGASSLDCCTPSA